MRGAALAAGLLLASVSPVPAQTGPDSLLAAARRAARAWQSQDFATLLGGRGGVVLHLPGSAPSAPLRQGQAVELLRVFVSGTFEVSAEVVLARAVDEERGYVEVQRTYTRRGAEGRRVQTLYLGMRRDGAGFRVAEVRVVP